MSGLFQHSNCDVRLGWFNYLISGPEVHRWHHSLKLAESNANYAHSFVIWDLLFGTYFRPRGRRGRSPRSRGAELPSPLPRTAAGAVPLAPGRIR